MKDKLTLNNLQILSVLKNGSENVRKISRKTDIQYNHVITIAGYMEVIGLIKSDKIGSQRFYRLTKKGEKVEEHYNQMMRELTK